MLDFKELGVNGNDFELLVRELLFSMGMKVYWSGKGPDGGKDLICIETPKSQLLSIEKRWLVQCKHFAHGDRAVQKNDLDDIIDSCYQHDATGYLLVCSTYPSSTVVNRLEAITQNKNNNLSAIYLDSVAIERMLSTPSSWKIAQRFFPISANDGWKIYATENPNRWVVNYKGYYIHLSNRIGSSAEPHLESITARINEIEHLPLPNKHMIRPRAVHFDDKNGNYTWYIDYLYPSGEIPYFLHGSIKEILRHGYVLEDGQSYSFDVHLYSYSENSDHFDADHYDYYQPFLGSFSWGFERKEQINYHSLYELEGWELEGEKQEKSVSESFERLVNTLSKLDFVSVIRSINSSVEAIELFNQVNDWTEISFERDISFEHLFSAEIICVIDNEKKLDRLMRGLPISIMMHFKISKRFVYLPDMDENEDPDAVYDFVIMIHPSYMKNKFATRIKLMEYFDELSDAIEKFQNEQSDIH